MTGEERREDQILRERAAALARAGLRAHEVAQRPAVTFERGGRRYAVEARACLGVSVLTDLLQLPDLPQPLAGFALFRGEPLALFDLISIFGSDSAPETASGERERGKGLALVLGTDRPKLGLWADVVDEVVMVEASLFRSHGAPDPLLLGTGERLQVLDAERLMRDERFLIDQGE